MRGSVKIILCPLFGNSAMLKLFVGLILVGFVSLVIYSNRTQIYRIQYEGKHWQTTTDKINVGLSRTETHQDSLILTTYATRGKQESTSEDTTVHATSAVISNTEAELETSQVLSPTQWAENLWNVCGELGIRKPVENVERVRGKEFGTSMLFVADKYKLMTCSMFKAASTHWRKVYQVFQGYHADMDFDFKDDKKLRQVRNMNNTDAMNALHNYKRIIVFRDPLLRIISFYRDKLLRNGSKRKKMYYLASKIWYVARNASKVLTNRLTYEPTFEELIRFILKENTRSMVPYWEPMHWDNYTICCHPCEIQYTHVFEMDHVLEQANDLFKEIGVPSHIYFPGAYKGNEHNNTKLFNQYYSNLPSNLYNDLCDFYKLDYKLFGRKCPGQKDFL